MYEQNQKSEKKEAPAKEEGEKNLIFMRNFLPCLAHENMFPAQQTSNMARCDDEMKGIIMKIIRKVCHFSYGSVLKNYFYSIRVVKLLLFCKLC